MTLELFITILVISAAATSAAIEIIKTLLNNFDIAYQATPVAMVIAFVIGAAEILIYSFMNKTGISVSTLTFAICMGLTNAIGSNVGYDKLTDFIYALLGKKP